MPTVTVGPVIDRVVPPETLQIEVRTPEEQSILGEDHDPCVSLMAADDDPYVLVDAATSVTGAPLASPVGLSA